MIDYMLLINSSRLQSLRHTVLGVCVVFLAEKNKIVTRRNKNVFCFQRVRGRAGQLLFIEDYSGFESFGRRLRLLSTSPNLKKGFLWFFVLAGWLIISPDSVVFSV